MMTLKQSFFSLDLLLPIVWRKKEKAQLHLKSVLCCCGYQVTAFNMLSWRQTFEMLMIDMCAGLTALSGMVFKQKSLVRCTRWSLLVEIGDFSIDILGSRCLRRKWSVDICFVSDFEYVHEYNSRFYRKIQNTQKYVDYPFKIRWTKFRYPTHIESAFSYMVLFYLNEHKYSI